MRTIDTRGQQCPGPLMATRKALKESGPGEQFKVLTDRQNPFNNISRLLSDNGIPFTTEAEEGIWTITVSVPAGMGSVEGADKEYCTGEN